MKSQRSQSSENVSAVLTKPVSTEQLLDLTTPVSSPQPLSFPRTVGLDERQMILDLARYAEEIK